MRLAGLARASGVCLPLFLAQRHRLGSWRSAIKHLHQRNWHTRPARAPPRHRDVRQLLHVSQHPTERADGVRTPRPTPPRHLLPRPWDPDDLKLSEGWGDPNAPWRPAGWGAQGPLVSARPSPFQLGSRPAPPPPCSASPHLGAREALTGSPRHVAAQVVAGLALRAAKEVGVEAAKEVTNSPSSPRSEGFPRIWEHLVLKPRTVPTPGWSVRSPSLRASAVIVLCAAHDSGMSSQEADPPGDREAWQGLFLPGQLETTRSAAGDQAPREELGGPGREPRGSGAQSPAAGRRAVRAPGAEGGRGNGSAPSRRPGPCGSIAPPGLHVLASVPGLRERLSPALPGCPLAWRAGPARTPWALGRQAGWHVAVTRPAWDTRALFR